MNKRIISSVLVFLLMLMVFPIANASSAQTLTAVYSSGTVAVSGTGYAANTTYYLRVTSATSVLAIVTAVSGSSGEISKSITTGTLTSPTSDHLYMKKADGSAVSECALTVIAENTTPYVSPATKDLGNTTFEEKAQVLTITSAVTATTTNNAASVSVTDAQLAGAISKAEANSTGEKTGVVISVAGADDAKSVATSITQASFQKLAGDAVDSLTVSTKIGSVTFDSTALDSIDKGTTDSVTINIAIADTSTLSSEALEKISDRPVYSLSVTSGDSKITTFGGGTATVALPYTLASGEDANNIVVYYIDGAGALVMVPNCVYDPETKTVTFSTQHFSTYAIGLNAVSFTDVSGWYKDYVTFLAARGIIKGIGNGTYCPNESITRAQLATILANLSGDDMKSYTTSAFSDVNSGAWYFSAVQWAYAKGVITGINGKFDPDAQTSRQDIAVMLTRYAEKVAGYTLPKTNAAITFSDSSSISAYAAGAVASMQQAGIISGSNGSFSPLSNASRAEAAKMIALMIQNMLS